MFYVPGRCLLAFFAASCCPFVCRRASQQLQSCDCTSQVISSCLARCTVWSYRLPAPNMSHAEAFVNVPKGRLYISCKIGWSVDRFTCGLSMQGSLCFGICRTIYMQCCKSSDFCKQFTCGVSAWKKEEGVHIGLHEPVELGAGLDYSQLFGV